MHFEHLLALVPMFALQVMLLTPSLIVGFMLRTHRPLPRSINSYGDPDNSLESKFLRSLQRFYRFLDNKIIFTEDPDTPGLTFTTPVEWAPWMETMYISTYFFL